VFLPDKQNLFVAFFSFVLFAGNTKYFVFFSRLPVRPVHCQYEAQADDTYKPGQKQHEFKMQDTVVRQQAVFPHTSKLGENAIP